MPDTFPTLPGLSFPQKRTAIWRSRQQESITGHRIRTPLRTTPLWRYELSFEFLRSEAAYLEFQTLAGFYNSCMGTVLPFLYAAPVDYSVTAQSFGSGDGATTAFQLVRSLGGFSEPVYFPDASPLIYLGGVLKTVTTHYSVGTGGVVTFVTPPGSGVALTWTGTYKWLARFDDDEFDFERSMPDWWAASSLAFTTEIPR